ncbi:MAG TPA: carbohydrate porin [Verrucomicrobiae bacterium]|nr:carbohydrate porin [Verrucomicrobiae bacterium]
MIVFLTIILFKASARSEETAEASAGTRHLAPLPFQLVLPREHLLGDWGGTRTWLEERGITPTLTFVTDSLGNPSGGQDEGFTSANNIGLDLNFDLEKLWRVEGASLLFSMSYRFGGSLSANYIHNVFTVQQVFGGETFRVVNVSYLQKLFDDRLELRIGRIAAGDDFLVSPYNYVFVQNGFDGNPVGIFFNSPGMTAYPNDTWGVRVTFRPTPRTYIMGGVYNGDPSIRSNDEHGVDLSLRGPAFAIGEVGYQANSLPGDTGLIGNYKAGFWYDNSRFTNFNTGESERGNWGVYTLFDQVLVRFGEQGSHRGFGIAGSFLVSPDESRSRMPYFLTAALVTRGIFPSRPLDVAGLGVVSGYFSDDLRDSQQRAQLLDPRVGVQRRETAVELTYRFSFAKSALYVQPDLQYIIRPGGTGQISNALVLGAQVGVNF